MIDTMKPEQQRIAIAEAYGFERIVSVVQAWKPRPHPVILEGYLNGKRIAVPDYLNDLNAMKEARKSLTTPWQKAEYARILKSLTWDSEQPEYCAMDATAEQEAESFLKTLNLWKP